MTWPSQARRPDSPGGTGIVACGGTDIPVCALWQSLSGTGILACHPRSLLLPSVTLLLLLSTAVQAAAPAPSVFDVRAYGAAADGRALDTAAVNRAIDAAGAAGGGTVHFPAGTYLCGSIHLKSHVTLHLDPGATIEATADKSAYDKPEPNEWDKYQDFGHSHFHNSLIWGENVEDVAIVGQGVIHGKGLTRNQSRLNVLGSVGNKALALKNSRNVTLRDVSFLRGGHFAILATGVDNLTIDNVKFDTNRDGIDVDCCYNVRISNCTVNSPSDDGICLKSSYALGALRATENVTITNCQVSGYDVGTLLDGTFKRTRQSAPDRDGPTGRIKFGTESNGGFKNVTVSNCVFDHCRGLAIESVDGGDIDGVSLSNVTMRDVTNSPLFIRLGNRARGPNNPPPGTIRHVNISDVVVTGARPRFASILSGIPGHPIEDVRISNVRIVYGGGGTAKDAATDPPEKENAYPEPSKFGTVPAYGFFIRHVKGLEMHHVEVSYAGDEARPAFVLHGVAGAEFEHVKAQRAAGAPLFVLRKVSDFAAQNVRGVPDTRRDNVEQESVGTGDGRR